METAKVTTLDPCARRAQQAMVDIERIEKHAADREQQNVQAVQQDGKRIREAWRDYGAALLEQRRKLDNNKKFGEWVSANGLDGGKCSKPAVRANAIWLAEHWDDILNTNTKCNHNHPTNMRAFYRRAGYAWAREARHQTARREKSVRTERAKKKAEQAAVPKSVGWTVAVEEAYGGKLPRGFSRNTLAQEKKPEVEKEYGKEIPSYLEPGGAQAAEIAAVIRTMYARAYPDAVGAAVTAVREEVHESQRERFDRAVKKAVDLEVARQVSAQVVEATKAAHARMQEMFEQSQAALRDYKLRSDGIRQAMTKKEWQLVLGVLHPDRAPEDRREKFAEAFRIVRALQPYVEAFD